MQVEQEILKEYRTTWKQFVRRINELHDCAAAGEADWARIEAALLEAEKARLACNGTRDRLAAQTIGLHASVAPAAQAVKHEGRVRDVARLLWELGGKPEGTALADWLRAERLIRSAAAAVAQ